MNYLGYIALRIFTFALSFIPFSLLFILSDIIAFILKNIFRYRLRVITENISFCFPDITNKERKQIANEFYTNFIDTILEAIKGLSHNPSHLVKRFKLQNGELLQPYFDRGESVILFSQHYGNWEWGPICFGLQMQHHVVGVIKQLSNPYIHNYIRKERPGPNVSTVSIEYSGKYITNFQSEIPKAIILIADQYAYNNKRKTNVNFFDQKVSFHNGASIIAVRKKMPVFNIDIKRITRGQYHIWLVPICEAKNIDPNVLTQKYASHLESLIKDSPSSWLWSHKRFKDHINY